MASSTGNGTDGEDVFVGPLVPHDTHTLDGQKNREGLPELPVQSGGPDLVLEDGIGLTKDRQAPFRNGADDADGESRSRKGLAPDHLLRDAQLLSQQTHLVLEKVLQGLYELQVHLFR